jgi:glycosyltransferase involved in cell wall biosynthesis
MKNKLVYVITSLDYGGTQKQLYYIIKILKEQLNYLLLEPVIITLKRGGRDREKFNSLGLKIYDLNMPEKFGFLTTIFLLKYFLKFVFIILKEKPVIVHSFLFQANMFTIFIKIFFPKCKTILSERVAEKEKLVNLKISKMFYKFKFLYDKILVNSQRLKNFLVTVQDVDEKKVVVIPNMIDLQDIKSKLSEEEIRKELNLSKYDTMILSIGRLHKQKGYDILLEVSKKLKLEKEKMSDIKTNIVFIILGDGEERNVLEKEVQENKLENMVKFLGYKKNVYDYINACDIFLLKAISFNKPVISTDVEGVRELIENLPNCFVVPLEKDKSKTSDIIVEKILYLISLKGKIKNDYSKVVEKYLVKNVSKQFFNLYGC